MLMTLVTTSGAMLQSVCFFRLIGLRREQYHAFGRIDFSSTTSRGNGRRRHFESPFTFRNRMARLIERNRLPPLGSRITSKTKQSKKQEALLGFFVACIIDDLGVTSA